MISLEQYVRLHRRGLLGYLSVVGTGAALLPFAFKLPIPILIASMFVSGMSTSVFALIWIHTLQEMVPGNMLGRVYSIDVAGFICFITDRVQPFGLGDGSVRRTDGLFDRRDFHNYPGTARSHSSCHP